MPEDPGSSAVTVAVELPHHHYDIRIGSGLLSLLDGLLAPWLRAGTKLLLLTDNQVASHYLKPVEAVLRRAGVTPVVLTVPPGESSKSFAQLERLLNEALGAGIDRKTPLLALGGGVTGDLGGLLASLLLRGIPFIQLPTTLLAQVDSSVGGKTGINSRYGKNLIGSFYQPQMVVIDTDTLSTLPEREMRAGYAEIYKYGLLGDAAFAGWCEERGKEVLARVPDALTYAIATSCRHKAAIVAEDEKESGRRALLNLGHTFAHALELEAGYRSHGLLHGEAVAVGMVLAAELSVALGWCGMAVPAQIRSHLEAVGLPASLEAAGLPIDPAKLIAHMQKDKKAAQGQLSFVLLRAVGQAELAHDVPAGQVSATLERLLAS